MIQIMIVWLLRVCNIDRSMIFFSIYLHENHKDRLKEVEKYWSKITGFSSSNFKKTLWKKHTTKTKRTNISERYFGLLRIEVKASNKLVRKITGWFDGISEKIIGGSSNGRTSGFGPENLGPNPNPPAA